MTPSNRSADLTADLLHDLQAEDAAPTVAGPALVASASPHARTEPKPVLQTALYLAPRTWRRPQVSRAGRSVSLDAGPVRLRIGRDPS